jgi:hypothetical protein
VNAELEKNRRRTDSGVRECAASKKTDLRTAAFVLGIQRGGRAALARRGLREKIDLD